MAEGLVPGVRVLNAGETWTGRPSQVLDARRRKQVHGHTRLLGRQQPVRLLRTTRPPSTGAILPGQTSNRVSPLHSPPTQAAAATSPATSRASTSSATIRSRRPGTYFVIVFFHGGVHTLSLSGGSVEVEDAPLTAQGTTLHFVRGHQLQDAIVATFIDADPTPTISDNSATIDWGDGHNIGGNHCRLRRILLGGWFPPVREAHPLHARDDDLEQLRQHRHCSARSTVTPAKK